MNKAMLKSITLYGLLGAAAMLPFSPALAGAKPPSEAQVAQGEILPAAEVESLVRKWFKSYSDKDFETHNAMIHPDVVVVYPEMGFISPKRTAGIEFLVKTLEADEKAFINLRQEVDKVYVVGNTAFVEGWFIGSQLGSTIADDVKDSKMHFRFLHRVLLKDRKIKEVFSYYDTALPYQIQLGLQGPTKENPIPPWMMEMSKKQHSKK